MSIFRYMSFSLLLVFIACGGSNSNSSSGPKDLNFSTQTTPQEYCEMVLLSITSYRGNILAKEFDASKNIDKAKMKSVVGNYAEAIRKKDWIRDDYEMKQDGNKFSKTYRWLDKRRRMAMTIIVNCSKRGNEITLDDVEFDTNIDILEKVKFN